MDRTRLPQRIRPELNRNILEKLRRTTIICVTSVANTQHSLAKIILEVCFFWHSSGQNNILLFLFWLKFSKHLKRGEKKTICFFGHLLCRQSEKLDRV